MENTETRKHNELTKQWLQRYRDAKKDVRRLEEEIKELEDMQKNAQAVRYTDMPKGSSSQSDLSDYIVRIEKISQDIYKAKCQKAKVFQEIRNAIEQLPTADERAVMSYRYLRLMTWEKISEEIGYSWRQVHYLHNKALKNTWEYVFNT